MFSLQRDLGTRVRVWFIIVSILFFCAEMSKLLVAVQVVLTILCLIPLFATRTHHGMYPYSRKIWRGIKFGGLADWPAYRRIKIRQYKVILDISRCGLWVVAAVLGDLYLCGKWMSCHYIDSSRKLACQREYHHENITTFHCDYVVNRAFSLEK